MLDAGYPIKNLFSAIELDINSSNKDSSYDFTLFPSICEKKHSNNLLVVFNYHPLIKTFEENENLLLLIESFSTINFDTVNISIL